MKKNNNKLKFPEKLEVKETKTFETRIVQRKKYNSNFQHWLCPTGIFQNCIDTKCRLEARSHSRFIMEEAQAITICAKCILHTRVFFYGEIETV